MAILCPYAFLKPSLDLKRKDAMKKPNNTTIIVQEMKIFFEDEHSKDYEKRLIKQYSEIWPFWILLWSLLRYRFRNVYVFTSFWLLKKRVAAGAAGRLAVDKGSYLGGRFPSVYWSVQKTQFIHSNSFSFWCLLRKKTQMMLQ